MYNLGHQLKVIAILLTSKTGLDHSLQRGCPWLQLSGVGGNSLTSWKVIKPSENSQQLNTIEHKRSNTVCFKGPFDTVGVLGVLQSLGPVAWPSFDQAFSSNASQKPMLFHSFSNCIVMKSDIRHVNTVLNVDMCHFAICIIVYVANVSSACTSSMSTTYCIASYTVVLLDIIDPTVSLCHAVIKNNNNHLKKTTATSYSGAHCKKHHF